MLMIGCLFCLNPLPWQLRRIEVRIGDMMIRSRRMGRGCRLLVSLSVAVLVGLTRCSLAEVVRGLCKSYVAPFCLL